MSDNSYKIELRRLIKKMYPILYKEISHNKLSYKRCLDIIVVTLDVQGVDDDTLNIDIECRIILKLRSLDHEREHKPKYQ